MTLDDELEHVGLPGGQAGRMRSGGTPRTAWDRPQTDSAQLSPQCRSGCDRAQSIEGELKDAQTVVWRVPVPANGETKLTATVTTGG